MPVPSPFPKRVYFILNVGRFTEILGSTEAVRTQLVWVPTESQARSLLAERGGDVTSALGADAAGAEPDGGAGPAGPGPAHSTDPAPPSRQAPAATLLSLYERLEATLRDAKGRDHAGS
jgi:hypothetical protein